MRLSDKNIEAIRLDAENCVGAGMGDILLLCDEIQTRRKNGENATTELIGDRLLERLVEGGKVNEGTRESLIEMLKNGRIKNVWEVNDEVTNTTLIEELIKRVGDNESISDALVLSLFHALMKQGYFQTICAVDRTALRKVMHALSGQDYLIRELQATRGLPLGAGETKNPIDQLQADLEERDAAN